MRAASNGLYGKSVEFKDTDADAVACLPVPRAQVFPSLNLFSWWSPLLFIVFFGIIQFKDHSLKTVKRSKVLLKYY
jgi:hypothetical protein